MTDLLFTNLAPRTASTRRSFLKQLGIERVGDWEKLSRINKIIKEFVKSSDVPTTQRTRIFHIIEFLKLVPQAKDLLEDYQEAAQPIIKAAIAKVDDNSFTNDKKADRYLPIKELRAKLSEMPESLDKVILSLYIDNPPMRNNYYDMNIVYDRKDLDSERNNLLVNKRGITLITDKSKTFGKYGTLVLKLSPETERLIRKVGFPLMKEDNFKKRVSIVSKRVFGVPISINDYRHIYEIELQNSPEYNRMTVAQRKKAHELIGHSASTAQIYNRV